MLYYVSTISISYGDEETTIRCHFVYMFRLVISARSEDLLTETLNECLTFAPDVYKVIGDVGLAEDCAGLVDTAVEVLGGLDVLVINAAYTPDLQWFSSDRDVVRYWCTHTHTHTRMHIHTHTHTHNITPDSSIFVSG